MADPSTMAQIAQKYPAFAPLMQIPDVANLLVMASGANWTNDEFTLHLHDSGWWKSTPEQARTWQVRKLTDPATAGRDSASMGNKVMSMAMALGIPYTPQMVAFTAEAALDNGWSDQELQQKIVANAQEKNATAGSITSTQTALRGVASDYGIPVSDHTAFNWAKKIASGQTDQKAFEEYAKDQAKLSFPQWAKQLDEGHSLRDLADPYIQIAAKTLEISPDQVDLTNPKWQRALQQRDAKGNHVGPMSHLDWQRTLMQDQSYGYDRTDGARQAAFQMVGSLEQSFGAAK